MVFIDVNIRVIIIVIIFFLVYTEIVVLHKLLQVFLSAKTAFGTTKTLYIFKLIALLLTTPY